jgi:hypothetical protein
MKVEFSRKIHALFSRYSGLNDPMGNPDSNLLALNWAAENSKTIQGFDYYVLNQKLPRITKRK